MNLIMTYEIFERGQTISLGPVARQEIQYFQDF